MKHSKFEPELYYMGLVSKKNKDGFYDKPLLLISKEEHDMLKRILGQIFETLPITEVLSYHLGKLK